MGCSFVAGIEPRVIKQIQTREEKFGKSPKTDKELMIIHGNCPWVVLRSGVDAPKLEENRWRVFPRENPERCLVTNDWAKKTVLGGELQNRSGDNSFVRPRGIQTQPGKGIDATTGTFLNSAYRITDYQGHRPVAGITDVTVTSKDTWGMIMEAVIKIKCWSRDELDLLDRVYFKPGYSAILEWGHTLYFKEDGTECITPHQMISDEEFFAGGNYMDLDAKVLEKRKEDSNREALFGYITNFSFSLNKDGSYDCSVKMLSKGSVIRGLRIKGSTLYGSPDENREIKEDEILYEDISIWHKIHQAFIDFVEQDNKINIIDAIDVPDSVKNYRKLPPRSGKKLGKSEFQFDGLEALLFTATKESINRRKKKLKRGPLFNSDELEGLQKFPVISIVARSGWTTKGARRHNREFYITLRTLLLLVNHFNSENRIGFNLWDTSTFVDPEGDDETPAPSLNPYIAVKPRQGSLYGRAYSVEKDINRFADLILENGEWSESEAHRILNIWINFDLFLLDIEHELEGKVEDYSIMDALQNLLGRVQKAFGNINDFQIVADHKNGDNLFTIIDNNCIYVESEDEIPVIRVTGLNNTISDLQITSEVSSDLANQMSIAAQAPRTYQDGSENADESMIHWGENCENRWWLPAGKDNASTTSKETEEALKDREENYKKTKEKWVKKLKKAYESVRKGKLDIGKAEGQTAETTNSEAVLAASEDRFRDVQLDGETYMHELAAKEVTQYRKPNLQMGIIPIRVGLTMMGIGNLTIGNVFRIKSGVMLPKYTTWAQIITGIEHHISRLGWTTTLKTQYYPLYYGDPNKKPQPKPTGYANIMQEGVNENVRTGVSYARQNLEALENDCGLYKAFTQDAGFDFNNPRTNGGYMGWCAWYTYGWADAYVNGKKNLRKGSKLRRHDSNNQWQTKDYTAAGTRGPIVSAGGNANSAGYWNSLKKLGYTQGTTVSMTGSTLAAVRGGTAVGNSTVKKGDVIVIYNGSNTRFHTAFWTGERWVSDTDQRSANCYSSGGPWNVILFSSPAQHPDWNCSG